MARVLIVEDDLTIQEFLKTSLERFKIECLLASDGLEAQQLLELGDIDLVLLDIKMPNMDGMEVVKWARSRAGDASTIPMIAITAHALSDFVQELQEAGFNRVLTKPFYSNQLVETIMSL